MSVVAKPMIWSNLRTGSPAGDRARGDLVARGMRSAAAVPSPASSRAGEDVDPGDDDIVLGAQANGQGCCGHRTGPPRVIGSIIVAANGGERLLHQGLLNEKALIVY